MAERRRGTIPQHVRLTQATSDRIDTYQEQHRIPSFSATVETLVRIGLEQSPGEILAPIIASTIRRELALGTERLVKLLLYDIVETGVAQRLAGAALLDIGRLKQDDPQRYEQIKQAAITDTHLRLRRTTIATAIADLYTDVTDTPGGTEHRADGDGDH